MSAEEGRNPVSSRPQGIIARTIAFFWKAIGILLFSAALSIGVEWIGMTFWEGYIGYSHAREMLATELSYLQVTLMQDSLSLANVFPVGSTVDKGIHALFYESGLIDLLNQARTPATGDNRMLAYLKYFFASFHDYLMAALYVLATFFVRLAILILSSPIFILFGVVALTDGLVRRDLRKWGAGLESGFVYHIAKRLTMPLLAASWIVYLALPTNIPPHLIILPFAIGFAFALMTMASKFKKHL